MNLLRTFIIRKYGLNKATTPWWNGHLKSWRSGWESARL